MLQYGSFFFFSREDFFIIKFNKICDMQYGSYNLIYGSVLSYL